MDRLRKLRAALVIGLTWAVAWGAITAAGIYAIVLLGRSPAQRAYMATQMGVGHNILLSAFVVGAILGFTAGVLFSVLLATVESRAGSPRMAVARVLTWGSVAGIAMSGVIRLITGWSFPGAMVALFLLSGGAAAVATLVLARRGTRLQRPLEPGRLAQP